MHIIYQNSKLSCSCMPGTPGTSSLDLVVVSHFAPMHSSLGVWVRHLTLCYSAVHNPVISCLQTRCHAAFNYGDGLRKGWHSDCRCSGLNTLKTIRARGEPLQKVLQDCQLAKLGTCRRSQLACRLDISMSSCPVMSFATKALAAPQMPLTVLR